MSGGRALSGCVRKARSEAARFPARLRASAGWSCGGRGRRANVRPRNQAVSVAASERARKNNVSGLGRGSVFGRLVAGQSRSRRLVETAEKVGRPGGLSPGVERLVSYQNA
jgi:hypothetical protein